MHGRCPEQPVTHTWAAGQFSQRAWPSQGSGPGSIAGLGGHGLPERWGESVLEGSLGSRQQEPSLECPPASPNTPRACPGSGSKRARDSPSEGERSPEETKARCPPGSRDSVCGLTHRVVARGSFQRLRPLWTQSPGHREKGPFLEARLRSWGSMTRPVPALTRAGKAVGNAWLEGRQNWPLVAGRAES